MPTQITQSDDGSHVLVEHIGTLRPDGPTPTRKEAVQHLANCHRALADFRQADLSLVRFIDVDTIASCLSAVAPQITRVAIVRKKGEIAGNFRHAKDLYYIQGVEASLFENMEAAKAWLLSD